MPDKSAELEQETFLDVIMELERRGLADKFFNCILKDAGIIGMQILFEDFYHKSNPGNLQEFFLNPSFFGVHMPQKSCMAS